MLDGHLVPTIRRSPISLMDMWGDLIANPQRTAHPKPSKSWLTAKHWGQRQGADYEKIRHFIKQFQHKALMNVTVEEIEAITSSPNPKIRTEHATADQSYPEGHHKRLIRKDEPAIIGVAGFSTPWALQYLFHRALEEIGQIPRWSDIERLLKNDWSEDYYEPYLKEFHGTWNAEELERGFKYRVGNAYYSFLREIDMFVRLREIHGIDLRYHIFADVVFRLDFWCDNTLICLHVPNKTYTGAIGGRKKKLTDVFETSGFNVLVLEQPMPGSAERGRCATFPRQGIETIAGSIKAAQTDFKKV